MGRFEWLEFEGSDNNQGSVPQAPAPAALSSELLSQEFLDKADSFFFAGLYAKALREYSRAIEENNGNREAWIRQNVCQIALHQPEQAIVWAQKFCDIFPGDPQALSSLAFAKSRIPDYRAELPELMEEIDMQSQGRFTAQMQFERAACLFALGHNDEGQKTIAQLLESQSSRQEQIRWTVRSAAFFFDMGAMEFVRFLLESLEKASGITPYGLSLWIKAEWMLGNDDKARRLLRLLRRRDRQAADIYEIADFFESHPCPGGASTVKQYISQLLSIILNE
ncbi:hypothetical protein IJT17_08310 [bacterium]|nr:hypothetical protein [bacterium]